MINLRFNFYESYKINVKYKAMNLHSKFYILFVHNQRKITKNLTSESILSCMSLKPMHLPLSPEDSVVFVVGRISTQ